MPRCVRQRRGGSAEIYKRLTPHKPSGLQPLEPRTLLSATLSAEFVAVNNTSALSGYTTADLEVTSTTDWTSAALLLELSQGSIYQDANGDIEAPNPALFGTFPSLEFDTYLDAGGNSVFVAGDAGDVGGDVFQFDTSEVDALWFDVAGGDTGTLTLGRFTLTDDAVGTWSLRVLNIAGDEFTDSGSFDNGNLGTPDPQVIADEADLTGDGKSDILWRNHSNGKNTVWEMDGLAFQNGIAIEQMTNLSWSLVGIADFTGDGKNDLLWRHEVNGRNIVWEMDGTTFRAATSIKTLVKSIWRVIGVGDFTGDGRADILWRNTKKGKNLIWEMRGTSFQSTIAIRQLKNFDWQAVGVSDFTADGKVDILWRNTANGRNTIWIMNGTVFQAGLAVRPRTNIKWQVAAVADFTGDGKTDILWRHTRNGRNTVWEMDGKTFVTGTAIRRFANLDWQTGVQSASGTAGLQSALAVPGRSANTQTTYTPIALSHEEDSPLLGLWESNDE